MPLINTSLPNLIQGVSQQPDAIRYDGQCKEQVNALSSVVDGLTKRPNTRHIARLLTADSDSYTATGALPSDTFVHFIDRDDREKYTVIHDGTKLRAYNLFDGTQATIKVGDTVYSDGFTVPGDHYVAANNPAASLKALTVADSTFILNRNVPVAPGQTKSAEVDKKGFVYVNRGDYQKDYTIVIETEGIAEPTTPAVITVTLERFVSETFFVFGLWEIYAWRIASATVVSGGSGYTVAPTIEVSSNRNILEDPVLTAVINDAGEISAVNVESSGKFAGVNPGTTIAEQNGALTPTVSVALNNAGTGTAAQTYTIAVTSGSAEAEGTAANEADTTEIAAELKAKADTGNADDVFTITNPLVVGGDVPSGSSVVIFELKEDANIKDFKLTTTDGLSDTGLQGVYKEIDSISKLPAKAPNNFKIKVVGDPSLNEDDYYVKFTTTGGEDFGDGTWEEVVGFGVRAGMENSTLPHQLVNTALNEFELKPILTLARAAGDDKSNPLPSFVGSRLSGMFFYKNRLGFLSEDKVSTTESGLGVLNDAGEMQYNFSRLTVTALLDSAPIDVGVAHNTVTYLRDAIAFQENLILFSDNGQFVLKGADLLTPKTVSITPVTNYETIKGVAPISIGSYVYFPFERQKFTGLREYSINASTDVYDSSEVTEHVPHYIPSNVVHFTGSASEDVIALTSIDEPNAIYIYKFFFSSNNKILSSWCKFTFDGSIRGMRFIESNLYLVITDTAATETNLVSIPFSAGITDSATTDHTTYLDMRVPAKVLSGTTAVKFASYTADKEKPLRDSVSAYDQTKAPYRPASDSLSVVTVEGTELACSSQIDGTVVLDTAVTADTLVWVGLKYTMTYTFSEQIFKAQAGQGRSPSASTKVKIRNGSVYYNDTAHFDVKVTPEHRDTYTNTFSSTVVGSSTLGTLNLDTGFYRFPVFTEPHGTLITIENTTALPSNFQSAEFESFTHARSTRYG